MTLRYGYKTFKVLSFTSAELTHQTIKHCITVFYRINQQSTKNLSTHEKGKCGLTCLNSQQKNGSLIFKIRTDDCYI